jgi:hypothetical protein
MVIFHSYVKLPEGTINQLYTVYKSHEIPYIFGGLNHHFPIAFAGPHLVFFILFQGLTSCGIVRARGPVPE